MSKRTKRNVMLERERKALRLVRSGLPIDVAAERASVSKTRLRKALRPENESTEGERTMSEATIRRLVERIEERSRSRGIDLCDAADSVWAEGGADPISMHYALRGAQLRGDRKERRLADGGASGPLEETAEGYQDRLDYLMGTDAGFEEAEAYAQEHGCDVATAVNVLAGKSPQRSTSHDTPTVEGVPLWEVWDPETKTRRPAEEGR